MSNFGMFVVLLLFVAIMNILNITVIGEHVKLLREEIKALKTTRSYELDVVDEKYILYNGNIPVAVLDSSEVGLLHQVVYKDNE